MAMGRAGIAVGEVVCGGDAARRPRMTTAEAMGSGINPDPGEKWPRVGKRIALIVPSLLPFGGVERVALMQIGRFVKLGFDVDLVLLFEPNDVSDCVPPGVRVFKLDARRVRYAIGPLIGYLRRERPDAVHATMWPLTSICLLARRLARSHARIVVSDHNTMSIQYCEKGFLHNAMMRASIALTYPWANGRVAVSAGVAGDLAAISGIPHDRFTVIYNPLTLFDAFESDDAEAAWAGWTGPRVITVGRLKAQKNHPLLLKAFKKLLETIDARLMILGVGELEQATLALVEAEGLSGKVVMPGQAAAPGPFYRSADLFVLSSDYEGFGNVIIEALACGVPVVSTNCPSGPAEILENGRYGRLVPVGDLDALAEAMAEALNEPVDREKLKRRGNEFSIERANNKYLELLLPDYQPSVF
jgi:glycosyltransferase involved in cell wall biosynthesis